MEYRDRSLYRNFISSLNLVPFEVRVKETDLYILADTDLSSESMDIVINLRSQLEEYIARHHDFLISFQPVISDLAVPEIVRSMLDSSRAAGVGPMASVAGAVSDYVGRDLLRFSKNVIVENGGDIFLQIHEGSVRVGIFAGDSPLSLSFSILVKSEDTPVGICTSSGTVGHSISLGKADAVCIKSRTASLADAAATAVGNLVRKERDIESAIEFGSSIEGVLGIVLIKGKKMGLWGQIEIV